MAHQVDWADVTEVIQAAAGGSLCVGNERELIVELPGLGVEVESALG